MTVALTSLFTCMLSLTALTLSATDVVADNLTVNLNATIVGTTKSSEYLVTTNTDGLDYGFDAAGKSMSMGWGGSAAANFGTISFYDGKTTSVMRLDGAAKTVSIQGDLALAGLIAFNNAENTYVTNYTGPVIYSTDWTGGAYPFQEYGNLVISPRLSGAQRDIVFSTIASTANMVISRTGNVGIGTSAPQSKLAVNGTITAKEVDVTTTGWSDFVFDDDYRLMPLDEVEQRVKADRHLPDIPSAAELEHDGMGVSDMLQKHMQKIEELTLYLIEERKARQAAEARVEELERRLEALEKRSQGTR